MGVNIKHDAEDVAEIKEAEENVTKKAVKKAPKKKETVEEVKVEDKVVANEPTIKFLLPDNTNMIKVNRRRQAIWVGEDSIIDVPASDRELVDYVVAIGGRKI